MPLRRLIALIAFLSLVAIPVGAQDKGDPKEPAKITAPYATATGRPLETKEEVTDKADDHTRYRVEFNGIKEDRVPAFLYVPKSKANVKQPAYPAVLLQYGIGGNKTTDYIVAIGKQFVAKGFVVLTIDSPGQGERRKKDDNKIGGVLGMLTGDTVMHYCGDYSRAVDFLASRPEVDKDKIGYVGISWGAITGITYCAYDPRIKAVGSMVGGGNFLGQFSAKEAEKTAKNGSKASDPVYHVARIAPRPLLFINVTKDQLIPKAWAESLHKQAGEGSKVVWLETDHYFAKGGVDRAAICESVIEFMDQKLCMKKAPEGK
jgi:dienelactone hydrolase